MLEDGTAEMSVAPVMMRSAALRKPRIVMVDDEADFLALASRWLERDYELMVFTSGVGVYEMLADMKPDLVILDVRMEPVSGYELCRRIRDDARFDLVSVLFLTGARSQEDLILQIEAGGSGFLNKPIDPAELRRVIAEELAA